VSGELREVALGAVAAAAPDAGAGAWVVGGAVRDELLGRPIVDLDIACTETERAARAAARASGGSPFPLSERHGAWRVVLADGRTIDFTPLAGTLVEDLAQRDFTVNAMASPLAGGPLVDPHDGQADLRAGVLRHVSAGALDADPVRLLRAVRFEDELGLRMEPVTEAAVAARAALVTRPAGERVLAELQRLSAAGWRRLDELGLLVVLGGGSPDGGRGTGAGGRHLETLAPGEDAPPGHLLLVAALGEALLRLPVSNDLRRYARTLLRAELPADASARVVHRFRRVTEPWSLDALVLLGADEPLHAAVRHARATEPAEPLVRGDELNLPPGPQVGRILAAIAEERAAGTITTRDEALALARREGAL
jgi:tRNA nucleotidyltransferase/poly(A) polymerase